MMGVDAPSLFCIPFGGAWPVHYILWTAPASSSLIALLHRGFHRQNLPNICSNADMIVYHIFFGAFFCVFYWYIYFLPNNVAPSFYPLSWISSIHYPLFHGVSHYSKLGFYNRAEFVIYCHNYDNTYGYGVEYPCILFYFSFSCFQTLCLLFLFLFLFGLWAFRAETLSSLNIFFRTIIPSHLYFSKTFTSYPSRVTSSWPLISTSCGLECTMVV